MKEYCLVFDNYNELIVGAGLFSDFEQVTADDVKELDKRLGIEVEDSYDFDVYEFDEGDYTEDNLKYVLELIKSKDISRLHKLWDYFYNDYDEFDSFKYLFVMRNSRLSV